MANHTRNQVLSMRGAPVDFGALALANADKPALGNANMNAKGDILGAGGVVLKTQEQIAQEWSAKQARQVTITSAASIKADSLVLAPTPSLPSDMEPLKPAASAPDSFPTVQDLIDSGALSVAKKKSDKND